MVGPGRTVFLSYRREVSWAMAHLVRNDLVEHGFDVFMDVHGIDSGEFERLILREIERREHFLVLLEPRSLDRIAEEGDWLRREIACALSHGRNVVPLLANDARMPRPTDLPADVVRLLAYNAVSVPHDYFSEAMRKLRDRFLRVPGAPASTSSLGTDAASARPMARGAGGRAGLHGSDLGVPGLTATTSFLRTVVPRWTAVPGARAYVLERAVGDVAPFTQRYRGTALHYRDAAPVVGKRARATRYRIRAEAYGAEGAWSELTWPEHRS